MKLNTGAYSRSLLALSYSVSSTSPGILPFKMFTTLGNFIYFRALPLFSLSVALLPWYMLLALAAHLFNIQQGCKGGWRLRGFGRIQASRLQRRGDLASFHFTPRSQSRVFCLPIYA